MNWVPFLLACNIRPSRRKGIDPAKTTTYMRRVISTYNKPRLQKGWDIHRQRLWACSNQFDYQEARPKLEDRSKSRTSLKSKRHLCACLTTRQPCQRAESGTKIEATHPISLSLVAKEAIRGAAKDSTGVVRFRMLSL